MSNKEITVKGLNVKYKKVDQSDYISLTDIAKFKTPQTRGLRFTLGCEAKKPCAFLPCGKNSIIRILTVSNSIRLQRMPARMPS